MEHAQNAPQLEGLLHLGALVVVLSLGYLGIDRLHSERHNFYAVLDDCMIRARGMVGSVIAQDLEQPAKIDVEVPHAIIFKQLMLICYIGQINVNNAKRIHKIRGWWHRSWRLPFLGYFRSKTDRLIVAIIAVISTISFLVLVFDSIDRYFSLSSFWLVTFYVFYVISILWVVITAGAAAGRLVDIENTMHRAFDEWNHLVQNVGVEKIAAMMDNVEAVIRSRKASQAR